MSKAAYLLALPVVVAAAWGGSTWYVGQQTKGVMDEFIKKNNELNSVHGLQQEVVSYDQGFLNSKAVIKLNMTQPPFNELVKDLKFNAKIKNGPVLMGEEGIGTGLSRWVITLDQESIQDATIKATVKEAFGGKDPFVGTMDIGFGNNYASKVVVNPMSYKADGNDLSFAGATITGTGNANEYTGKAKLEGGEFKATLEDGTVITAPKTTADVDMTGLVGSSLLGTVQMKMNQVSFAAKELPTPITLDIGVDTKSDKVDQALNGTVSLSATNIKGVPEEMLSNARYDLAYNDFKVEGVEELGRLQNELQGVQSQIDFNAVNTETPEGQKKTMELFGKIQEISGEMMEAAFTKMLVADKSRLTQKIALDNPKGKTQLDIDLTYHGGDKVPTMNDLMMQTFSAEQWANLVRGSVTLNADKAMLPPIAGMMLMQPVEQGLLEDSANQYKLNLKLNGEQVELNGKSMPIMELLTKVGGGAGSAPADEGEEELPEMSGEGVSATELESLGVPADIAKEMEANGLTAEVMKKLEDNKDINPEVLEMMRQLQQMQQGTDGTAPDQPTPAQ